MLPNSWAGLAFARVSFHKMHGRRPWSAASSTVDDLDEIPDTRAEFQRIIDKTADNTAIIQAVERFEFYEQAKRAYCIMQTAERRLYGNIILKKDVVATS
jgi:L-fucose mutarotase/ribose pyranase (RbsD/FucU family)